MKKTILSFSLGAVLFGTWAAHGAPSASMMFQLTLAKMNALLGTTSINATTGITTNNVSLGDLVYTSAGAANSSLSHIWSDGNAGNLTLGVPKAKTVTSTINGTEYFSLGKYDGYINAVCWAIGRQTSTTPYIKAGTASVYLNSIGDFLFYRQASQQLAIGLGGITSFSSDLGTTVNSTISLLSDAANTLTANVPSGGTLRAMVNGTTVASISGTNACIFATSQVTLANSTTVVLMPAAGRYGLLDVCDNKGNWGRFHLRGTGAPVLSTADACGPNNYLVSSAPSTYQVAVNVTSGNVVLMNGSDMACNITSIYRGF